MPRKQTKATETEQKNSADVVSNSETLKPVNGELVVAVDKIVRRPSNRIIASTMIVRRKKQGKQNNLKKELAETKAIRKRGYYIVKVKGETKHVSLDAADREYLLAKETGLDLQIKALVDEIKSYTHFFKSRSRRAKQANRRDLGRAKEKELREKVSRTVLSKVEKILTEESVASFPKLSELITGDQNTQQDLTELEKFFSANLSEEFRKFSQDPKLKQEIFSDTLKYVKEISN